MDKGDAFMRHMHTHPPLILVAEKGRCAFAFRPGLELFLYQERVPSHSPITYNALGTQDEDFQGKPCHKMSHVGSDASKCGRGLVDVTCRTCSGKLTCEESFLEAISQEWYPQQEVCGEDDAEIKAN